MKIKLFMLCVFLMIISCVEEVIKEPENLIPQEKMEAILYDLAILNSTKGTAPNLLNRNNIESMPFIYKEHGIDSIQFVESDLYYASKPLLYQKIYTSVETKLEAQVKALEVEKKRKRDSIKEASKKRVDSLKTPIKLSTNDSLPKK